MAKFAMARLRQPTILNIITVLVSLALIAFSIASLYYTANGTKQMGRLLKPGEYTHTSGYPDIQQNVTFKYNLVPNALTFAACAISCAVALISIVGAALTQKKHNSSSKLTFYTLSIPSFLALIVNLVALIYTFAAYKSDDFGACDKHWELYWKDKNPEPITMTCSRENAAAYGLLYDFELRTYSTENRDAYRKLHKGRQLLAPLFVANLLLCFVTGMKWWDQRKKV
ncbi:hypothetical protein NX059_006514 [Plenodomus lindquistii]|nr:hypothetical protein NX059_006514 [Plenodomus lindquistii]